jgi:GTP diphosphokinase / guanosine-3',5'-bis(diphosphate) 3'-diphosphatase
MPPATPSCSFMLRFDDLQAKVATYMPPEADLEAISRAYVYSATLHRNRFTRKGEPAMQHALEVSSILAEMRLDVRCIVAGLLHDALEDELAEPGALRAAVGEEPARLVEELSRLSRAAFHGTEAARAEHMRQMILASTRDLRVILILLADRLQLLRNPAQLAEEAQQAVGRETLAIYAPIAHRLGVHTFKAELEDLAWRILEPSTCAELTERVRARLAERSDRIEQINAELRELLAANGMRGEVLGRTKHLYSIHQKMLRDRIDLDRVYDLLASRIILDSTEECYRVLGLVHAAYTPMPGRFKDYIALPKENGYQSLHTIVFGSDGDIFEIQIRTREMHRQAEMGIAAHFIYKDGSPPDESELASVSWFRRLLEHLEQGRDPHESMEQLRRDLAPDQVFVFTPRGEVIKLPPKATAIDFAYAIHSEVGHHCVGARMDGRMVSIRTPLRNGSVVEIVTAKNQEPKEDWLKSAVSSKASGYIRRYLSKKKKEEAVGIGLEHLQREARPYVRKVDELFRLEPFREWMQRHGLNTPDDVYAAEGFGRITIRDVLERLLPRAEPAGKGAPAPLPARTAKGGKAAKGAHGKPRPGQVVTIAGLDNMMIRFAKCCTPVYGDPVVGIITRGRGVSIHHRECRNLGRQFIHEERMVEVDWADDAARGRPVTLAISTRGSMKDLMESISFLEAEGTPITSGRIASRGGVYTQHLTLMVDDSKQLKRILQRLNAIAGIRAERVLASA